MTHMYPLCFWLLALVVGVTAIGRFLGTLAVEEMLKHGWKGSWSPVPWQVRQAASSLCLLECWLGHDGLTPVGMWQFLECKQCGISFPKLSLSPWKGTVSGLDVHVSLSKLNIKRLRFLLNSLSGLSYFIINLSFIRILQISIHLSMCWQLNLPYSPGMHRSLAPLKTTVCVSIWGSKQVQRKRGS